MRPSEALDALRPAVREAAARHRTANPHVFGSTLHGRDRDGSDLDLLVEEGMIAPGDLDMLSYVDSPEDAWQAIRDFYQPACGGGHAPSGLCDLFR